MQTLFPQTMFTVAQTCISGLPWGNGGRTLRLVVQSNLAAKALSVVFSNSEGDAPVTIGAASLALCDEHGGLLPDTLAPLTVSGGLHFTLDVGEDVTSDISHFEVQPGEFFALNLYYPDNGPIHSGNWLGNTALRSRPGNFSADPTIPGRHLASRFSRTIVGADMAVPLTNIFQIIAHCEKPARTLACFGDSITQQCTWTVPFTKQLYKQYPGEISLCNLGIAGNRLLADSAPSLNGLYGPAGVRRFAHDVLGLKGLTHCILALGANDVGLPGMHGIPDGDVPSLDLYARTLREMAATLHSRGVKVFAATVTPRSFNDVFDEGRELVRQEMNAWIRTAECFDAVLDFDAALRRDDGNDGMRPGLAQPDGLHPTPKGGLFLARSIPVGLFGEGGGTHGS